MKPAKMVPVEIELTDEERDTLFEAAKLAGVLPDEFIRAATREAVIRFLRS